MCVSLHGWLKTSKMSLPFIQVHAVQNKLNLDLSVCLAFSNSKPNKPWWIWVMWSIIAFKAKQLLAVVADIVQKALPVHVMTGWSIRRVAFIYSSVPVLNNLSTSQFGYFIYLFKFNALLNLMINWWVGLGESESSS